VQFPISTYAAGVHSIFWLVQLHKKYAAALSTSGILSNAVLQPLLHVVAIRHQICTNQLSSFVASACYLVSVDTYL
jgi:hypothetical protein